MDVTEGSEQRFQLGLEQFLAGQPVSFKDVTFSKDPTGFLIVSSFSEHVLLENSSPAEAAEKIRYSKHVLHSLAERSESFASVAGTLPHKYQFCHDYGKGSVLLASEVGGQFKWCN